LSDIPSLLLDTSCYQLLDFGDGRKLEQFGELIVDRPSPAAFVKKGDPTLWEKWDLRYEIDDAPSEASSAKGKWLQSGSIRERETAPEWGISFGNMAMRLKPTPAGQLGAFPEHWSHWTWLSQQLRPNQRVLNLFAYTGATTLALAAMGCEVTHVDSSKPTVQWARHNCSLSGMDSKPIRWIIDDAATFVRRELKRERTYELILLDPPTFGHGGGRGSAANRWEIRRDLVPLLIDCWQLLSTDRVGLLLGGHSSRIDIADLNSAISQELGKRAIGECQVKQAFLQDLKGRKLDCGFAATYSWPND
jgi:23S rRNA (cytosine1962-C5)-methyltransferase